ncbi:uncharacterized protein LOC118492065 [Helianthus annuus]|uniref:uncharacterized protein LOC118492065 n=1 Tax=Helianthus annuus TaxID=4232 RepID=UPI0016532E71|nr:uncharacterized protein LOC118492065 [Helianthus annuus]
MDNWIGMKPFKDWFPDLFKIAKNKQALVADFAIKLPNEVRWNIDWMRPPNNDAEWLQWSGMLNELNKIKFLTGKDRWGWVNEKWDEFSVATVKEHINKQTVNEQEERWKHWITWLPAKVNYFTWRMALGRIPVKIELRRRGVELDNNLCSRCGSVEESTCHLICHTLTFVEAYACDLIDEESDDDSEMIRKLENYQRELSPESFKFYFADKLEKLKERLAEREKNHKAATVEEKVKPEENIKVVKQQVEEIPAIKDEKEAEAETMSEKCSKCDKSG